MKNLLPELLYYMPLGTENNRKMIEDNRKVVVPFKISNNRLAKILDFFEEPEASMKLLRKQRQITLSFQNVSTSKWFFPFLMHDSNESVTVHEELTNSCSSGMVS